MPKAVEGQWTLDKRKSGYMTLASVAISFAGLFGFGWLCSLLGASNEFTITIKPGEDNSNTLLMLALIPFGFLGIYLALLVFHEWCHGLAARWVGAKPKYGAKFVDLVLSGFLCDRSTFHVQQKTVPCIRTDTDHSCQRGRCCAYATSNTSEMDVGLAVGSPPGRLHRRLVDDMCDSQVTEGNTF